MSKKHSDYFFTGVYILKKATGLKPDVVLVWFMQWPKIALEHGEKDRYWCIV